VCPLQVHAARRVSELCRATGLPVTAEVIHLHNFFCLVFCRLLVL
jgi:hypothetical protein